MKMTIWIRDPVFGSGKEFLFELYSGWWVRRILPWGQGEMDLPVEASLPFRHETMRGFLREDSVARIGHGLVGVPFPFEEEIPAWAVFDWFEERGLTASKGCPPLLLRMFRWQYKRVHVVGYCSRLDHGWGPGWGYTENWTSLGVYTDIRDAMGRITALGHPRVARNITGIPF